MTKGLDMKGIDISMETKEMREQFLKSNYFSALSIMTPKEKWLCIDRNEKNLDETYKSAKNMNIFNLVVTEGDNVTGFINVKYIKQNNEQYDIDWDKMEKIDNHSVPGTMHLFTLLEKMVKDADELEKIMSPLYFVLRENDGSGNPIGIISFWDLNRAPAYILSYPILVSLEHTLIIKIEKSHENWVEHDDLRKKIHKKYADNRGKKNRKLFEKFLEGPNYNYQKLSKLGLQELIYFYKNDPHIEVDDDKTIKNLIDLLERKTRFRNIIAHSVKLIVESDKFKDDLKDLTKIWCLGKTVFCNFTDPKVSYRQPVQN